MKTVHCVLPVPRLVQHLFRDLPRASFLFVTRLLCVERNGALVCCIPGAPIVRLPAD
ncbi:MULTISPECIES: hypothetical protein [unclassified Pseudomonas]|uniref:hypothetical protein n=1 Tax=unclassified Pseudomonas TaxID=196821 RepID=UPI002AC8F7E8|nr:MULTISPECIES: hypothetical protein [unclassified Pseudomonas]MEB0045943.1 hypothetical protein [Pseudomonas sp. Dout3]MEB0097203.1 hypothetical protein [Pseudomonas sp. DC1.2]WPX56859.1 hypothetical protein RHM68_14440 [Pseudomonas sp. DC1.2]